MSFLTPLTIAIAAGLTVPPLVLLYFLKLRRQEVTISSTFFWKQAVQDLQVNAPFQRLRKNLLLLLQLIVLALCILALGQPLLSRQSTEERSLIVLVDRSASMSVVEPDGKTRLDRAKTEARTLIEGMQESDRVMVIGFSDRASIFAPFTKNSEQALNAIDEIKPSQGLSRLTEAIALADAHAQTQIVPSQAGQDTPIINERPVEMVLISDGRVEDAETVTVDGVDFKLINVAINDDNVGITSLAASRHYERPEEINIVATLQNFGSQPATVDVELIIADDHMGILTVDLAPGIPPVDAVDFDPRAATATVTFPEEGREALEYGGSGVIEVVIDSSDALPVDNRAVAVIPPPHDMRILVVTPGNVDLKWRLDGMPLAVSEMAPAEYENAADDALLEAGRSKYDVVIFDACTSARLPIGNYLFLGEVPQVDGFGLGETREFDSVFDWDESHPVMRYAAPVNVDMLTTHELILPPHARILVDGIKGPLVAAVNQQGNRYLITGFSLLSKDRSHFNTTWATKDTFLIFLFNAFDYLAGRLEVDIQALLRPGDVLPIAVPDNCKKIDIVRPDGKGDTVVPGGLTTAHYGRTDLVGVYRASPTAEGTSTYAVNLFSTTESFIRPNTEFVIGGTEVASQERVETVNVPVWPWLLALALAVLLLEWAVYSYRILV